jgi:putative oxidoreductase
VPEFLQGLSTLAEFGGGLALIVGLLTPLATLGIAINMLVAIVMVHLKAGDPFIGAPGKPSFEAAGLYLGVALGLLAAGPGAFSLDAMVFGKKTRRDSDA